MKGEPGRPGPVLAVGLPLFALVALCAAVLLIDSPRTRGFLAVAMVPAAAAAGVWWVFLQRRFTAEERSHAQKLLRHMAIALGGALLAHALYRAALGQWGRALSSSETLIFGAFLLWAQRRRMRPT